MSDRVDLIAARERLGLSRPELSKAVRIAFPMVFRVETGQQDPSLAVMRRWVEVLGPGVTLDLFKQPPAREAVSLRPDRRQRKLANERARLDELEARRLRKRQRAEKKFQDILARFNAVEAQRHRLEAQLEAARLKLEGGANDAPLHQNAAA